MMRSALLYLSLFVLSAVLGQRAGLNLRPIIGVLTQPSGSEILKFGDKYIAASYVKYLESAGARVVPVQHDAPKAELRRVFESINGILLPGGGSDLDNTTLFQTGKLFYDWSIEAFDKGDIFPVIGHCQGFEMLSMITSEDFNILQPVDAENITLPLEFTDLAPSSRLFGSAPKEILNILSTQPVTMNNHQWSVYSSTFKTNSKLNSFYNPLSHNQDRNGQDFISTWEGQKYPVYGIQWHAEKPIFEWNPNEVINHSPDAVAAMQYMADFAVNQCRLSHHRYQNEVEEREALIYHDVAVYTFPEINDFEQCYFYDNWKI